MLSVHFVVADYMVYPYRESTKEYGVKPSDNDQEDKVRKEDYPGVLESTKSKS